MKSALFIPDCHIPYHNRKAYRLMLLVGRDLMPDEIVILGDFSDFYSVSGHLKDPRILQHLIAEVEEVNRRLDEIDLLFPNSKKIFIEGNHENRLERYLVNNAPALFGITSVEYLFKFNQRHNWKFIPYGPKQRYNVLGSKLVAKHTPIGSSAAVTARKAMCSVVYGHIHRIEQSYAVGISGEQHVAFSCGWLGDVEQDLVFGYVKNHHEWQLGFGIAHVDEKTGYFYHQIIPILDNYTCVYNGKSYA